MSEPVRQEGENGAEATPKRYVSMKERFLEEIKRIGGKLPPDVARRAITGPVTFGPPQANPFNQAPSKPVERLPQPETVAELQSTKPLELAKDTLPMEVHEPAREPAPLRELPPVRRVPHAQPVVPRAKPAAPFGQAKRRYLKTENLSHTEIAVPVWVVRCPRGDGLLPAGLSVLVGDPGAGKSTLIRGLVASLSTGEGPFRVDGPCEALFLAWEDDEASGILPHLLACGGDPRKVHMLRGVTDEEGRQIPWMPTPANIELVRDFLVCHPQVKLLVVDVLSSLLAMAGVDSSGSEEVRRVLDPLHKLGQETGVAVLLLHHQNKRVGERALVRVAGSVQVTGTARMVWLLAADPEDPSVRQLAAVKCNLAGKSAGFAFREQSADRHEVNQWAHKLGMVIPDNLPDYLFRKLEVAESQTVSAEDLLKGILETTEGSAEKCDEWLLATLAGNRGEITSLDLSREAKSQGIAERALAVCKTRLKAEGVVRYEKRNGAWWVVSKNRDLAQAADEVFDS